MHITYTYENVNLLIVLLGLILILHIVTLRRIESRTIKFANYETLKKVIGYEILHKNYLPLILRLVSMLLIIVAISNLTITIIKDVSNTDFIFAIDSSSSMLTSDNGTFEPSRLEAAKDSAVRLIDRLPEETEIGIVTFAGKSNILEELTGDHRKLKKTIRSISYDSRAGTAIGDALITSAGLLTNSSKKRVITLITDGRNNMGIDVGASLQYVTSNNVVVYTIGVGIANASMNISNTSIPSGLESSNASLIKFQELNETELAFIANQTNGTYFFVTNKDQLDRAFESAVLESDKKTIEMFKYVLLVATILLLLEWGLGVTKYKTIP